MEEIGTKDTKILIITKYESPRQEEKRKTIKWVHGKAKLIFTALTPLVLFKQLPMQHLFSVKRNNYSLSKGLKMSSAEFLFLLLVYLNEA